MEKGEIYFKIKSLWKGTIDELETKAGLSQGSIGKWKTSAPKIDSLCKVVDVLGCSYDELLSNSKKENETMHQEFKDIKDAELVVNSEKVEIKKNFKDNPIQSEMKDDEFIKKYKNEMTEDQKKLIQSFANECLSDSFYNNNQFVGEMLNRITKLCELKKISLEELFSRNYGLTKTDLELLRKGIAPSYLSIKHLAGNLGCSIPYLLFGDLSFDSDYAKRIDYALLKYKIGNENFSNYSSIPLYVLDGISKGFLPIGTLHWRIQNTICNLSEQKEKFDFQIDYENYPYYICEYAEAKNYIEMLKLPAEQQEKVWEFIKTLN